MASQFGPSILVMHFADPAGQKNKAAHQTNPNGGVEGCKDRIVEDERQ